MRSELILFGLAVQFLTRLPVPISDAYTPERMAASVRYYPLVGALIGVVSALVYALAGLIWPTELAVLIALGAGLFLTGAFHEDGLADTFDGLGGGATRERALEIMRDSRLGTYGTVALFVVLAIKVACLNSLEYTTTILIMIAAHSLSRLSSLVVIRTSDYVRAEGTGKPVAKGLSIGGLIFATVTALLALLPLSLFHPDGATAAVVAGGAVGHILARLFFERKLGGYTGDTLGAVQQFSEIGIYLGLAAWL